MTEPITVTKQIPVRILMTGTSAVLTSEFSYSTADPCAVKVVFTVGIGEEVEWNFSRELLKDGLKVPTGFGDVQISPTFGCFYPTTQISNSEPLLNMILTSPFGQANFIMSPKLVAKFVKDIYELVPEDKEHEHLNLDAGLAELLAEGEI